VRILLIHPNYHSGGAEIAGNWPPGLGCLRAFRIPRPAQTALKRLPPQMSAKLLMRAISAHAWTFAGDERFESEVGREAEARIYQNPICEGLQPAAPACVWHAAVLETLLSALVAKGARVAETPCRAGRAPCCRFTLSWRAPPSASSTPRALSFKSVSS
jgi:divinyl protochlorophyllide a 8-vinyl-reductase